MRDITNSLFTINTYGGSETKKTCYINGKKYMVKFPDPVRENNKDISYVNNQYSEYISCKIFEQFGIDVQKTELVKCFIDVKEKIAVMCEDFLNDDEMLIEFKTLSYSLSTEIIYTNELKDIFDMVKELDTLTDKNEFEDKFWDIFIVDTLIGNVDRHLGNWGIVAKFNTSKLSPVYDCGSALHPLLSETEIKELLKNGELKNISINLKTAYKLNGKTLNYLDIYKNMPEKLETSLKRMHSKISLDAIKNIIYSTPTLTDEMKEFYYKTIEIRKNEIIDKYYKEINI